MARGAARRTVKHVLRGTRARQLELSFPSRWGGARPGAGRKRGLRGNVWHRARPPHASAEPVHVTLRARISPPRSQHVFPTVRLALLRAARRAPERFRLLQYSVQRDHVHLMVEARDKRALSTGIQSIAIRIARYVNDLLGRHGALWADRWHGRALKTPREVRNALAYVLANFRKHGEHGARRGVRSAEASGIDPYSSGEWFDGWREWRPRSGAPPPFVEARVWCAGCRMDRAGETTHGDETRADEATDPVVSAPRSWLASVGWRRHGLVSLGERPRG